MSHFIASGMRGTLTVNVHRATQLRNTNLISKQNPYTKLKIGGTAGEEFVTRVHSAGGTEPVWEQSFIFNLDGKQENMLHILVCDKETLSDDIIGRADFPIALTVTPTPKWFQLVDRENFRVVTGQIALSGSFSGTGLEGSLPPGAAAPTPAGGAATAPAPAPAAPTPAPEPTPTAAAAAPTPVAVPVPVPSGGAPGAQPQYYTGAGYAPSPSHAHPHSAGGYGAPLPGSEYPGGGAGYGAPPPAGYGGGAPAPAPQPYGAAPQPYASPAPYASSPAPYASPAPAPAPTPTPVHVPVPYSPPPAPSGPLLTERVVLEDLYNRSQRIAGRTEATLTRLRMLITQASLPVIASSGGGGGGGGGYGAPAAAPAPAIAGLTPGMMDPKTNSKFPLNVRKNCREFEVKWLAQRDEIKAVLGYEVQLLCDFEAWYGHEKMDTHKKDSMGQYVYVNYMCSWAEGFLKFAKDVDNLDAFRVALPPPAVITLRLGWDKKYVAKQKAGYVQQFFEGGRLFIQANPNYIGSGLYELTNGDFIGHAL